MRRSHEWRLKHDPIYAAGHGVVATDPLTAPPAAVPCTHRSTNRVRGVHSNTAYYRCSLGHGDDRGTGEPLVCECASQPGGCIGCGDYTTATVAGSVYDSINTPAGEISIRAAQPFRSQDRALAMEVVRDDCYRLADLPELPTAAVIVDIGAHIGSFAAWARKLAPSARIVTAEACPDNWRILDHNVGRFAEVYRGAITNQPGPVRLANSIHAHGSTTGGSIVLDDVRNITSGHRLDPRLIPARTFAQFLDERGIDRVDILKVDAEGGEFDVLASPAIYRCNVVVGEWHGGRAKIEAAVARLAGFRLELLSESADGDQGIFRLRNPKPSPVIFVRRTLEIYSDAFGIGDAITGMHAAAGLANLGHRVRFRTRQAAWLKGGQISHPLVEVLPFAEVGVNFNVDYAGQMRAAQRGEIDSRTDWHLRNLSKAFHVPPFSAAKPNENGNGRKRVIDGDYVILCPFSADPSREWPAYRWMELADRLRGRKVIAFGAAGEESRLRSLFPASVQILAGKSPAFVCAAVEHAKAVISGDSGMAHIAGILGVPAIAIMSQLEPSFVFGIYSSVRGVFPGWGCRGCAWETAGGYKPECRTGGCGALASIQVDDVLGTEPLNQQ